MNINKTYTSQIDYIKENIFVSNSQKAFNAPIAVISLNTQYDPGDMTDWSNITYSIMQIAKRYVVHLEVDIEREVHACNSYASLLIDTNLSVWNITTFSPSSTDGQTVLHDIHSTLLSTSDNDSFEVVSDSSEDERVTKIFQDRVEWAKKKAEQHALHEDLCSLGLYYDLGLHVKRSAEQAFQYYTQAAQLGNYSAQCLLYEMYIQGDGIEQNQEMAQYWSTQARNTFKEKITNPLVALQSKTHRSLKELKLLTRLLWMHQKETRENVALKTSEELLKKEADEGVATAQVALANIYVTRKEDKKKGFALCLQAANAGLNHAQSNLGVYYEFGTGVEKDPAQAFFWYSKAADNNTAIGQYNLGQSYAHGVGTAKDLEKAVYWYTKAAEGGHTLAQNALACCYFKGKGILQDKQKAFFWFKIAAVTGESLSQLALGQYYRHEEKDPQKAIFWYSQAAEQDSIQARFELADCYDKGECVPENKKLAFSLFKQLAEEDIEEAQYKVGLAYQQGMGIDKNHKKAAYWFKKAAKKGLVSAQYQLAMIYYEKAEIHEAFKWCSKAEKRGNIKARQLLPHLHIDKVGTTPTTATYLTFEETEKLWSDEISVKQLITRFEKL